MFSIPVLGPSKVFCDNMALYNICFWEYNMQNKHNSICFHRVRECVASAILFVNKVDYKFNLSDILTNSLRGPLQKSIQERIMFITRN